MRKSIIRRSARGTTIPTASTADIAFLLILFFMVTTVFRATTLKLMIKLPEARSTERILLRKNVTSLWVDTDSKIYVDDNIVTENLVAAKIAPKVWNNPELIVILNIDGGVLYGVVDIILDQLKEAKAFRITFATEHRR